MRPPTGQAPCGGRWLVAWRPSGRKGWVAYFVVRRLLWLVPIVLALIVVTFLLVRLAPGNPWDLGGVQHAPDTRLSEAAVLQLNAKYGLDEPWWRQLVIYTRNVAQFDFGTSYTYEGRSVRRIIVESWRQTAILGGISFAVILPLGVLLGVIAALRHNAWPDHTVVGLATFGASIPNFVVGIFLIIGFALYLDRLTGGAVSLPAGGFGLDEHLIMPVMTLSILPTAFIARLTRSSMLDVSRRDHVTTARSKGLTQRRVVASHILKNSLVPVITTSGPIFSFLITGTVVVESVFQIPGLGGTFIDAIAQRDYPLILGITLLYGVVIAVANLVVDIAYLALDPRMRSS